MERNVIQIVGAAILDVLVRPADPDVFRSGSSSADEIRVSVGGDAANEAAVLARLGKSIRLDTTIGCDMAGDIVQKFCRDCGILLDPSHIRPDIHTGVNVVLIQENGERSFLTDPHGSLRRIAVRDVTLPFPDDTAILSFASIFTYPDFGVPEMEYLFRTAKEHGLIVCADMTSCKHGETIDTIAPALAFTDYLFPNEKEALLVTGEATVEAAAQAFRDAGVSHAVIKCGERGCFISSDAETGFADAVPDIVCVDTTGAGDSFAAGFIYGLSEGYSFRQCAVFANECGARAVSYTGASEWLKHGLPPKPDRK